MLADTPRAHGLAEDGPCRGRYLGMEIEADLVRRKRTSSIPLLDEKHFVGAMCDPIEGHLDPYGTTHAYAKSARIGGRRDRRSTRA